MQIILTTPEELKRIISETFSQDLIDKAFSGARKPLPALSEPLQTIASLSKELGVSRVTINAWMKAGELPYIRIGRRVYFQRSAILEAGKKKKGAGK